jgi:hypothetical protein
MSASEQLHSHYSRASNAQDLDARKALDAGRLFWEDCSRASFRKFRWFSMNSASKRAKGDTCS